MSYLYYKTFHECGTSMLTTLGSLIVRSFFLGASSYKLSGGFMMKRLPFGIISNLSSFTFKIRLNLGCTPRMDNLDAC